MRSSIEIYDLNTRSSRVVWQSEDLIEAPNWSPDGKWLMLNSDGRMLRLPVDGSAGPQRIDTGFAILCNNDHGIAPDGRFIAISDKAEFGKSAIYILPVAGGVPKLVTRNLPPTGTAGRRMASGSPIAASAAMSSISTRSGPTAPTSGA